MKLLFTLYVELDQVEGVRQLLFLFNRQKLVHSRLRIPQKIILAHVPLDLFLLDCINFLPRYYARRSALDRLVPRVVRLELLFLEARLYFIVKALSEQPVLTAVYWGQFPVKAELVTFALAIENLALTGQ